MSLVGNFTSNYDRQVQTGATSPGGPHLVRRPSHWDEEAPSSPTGARRPSFAGSLRRPSFAGSHRRRSIPDSSTIAPSFPESLARHHTASTNDGAQDGPFHPDNTVPEPAEPNEKAEATEDFTS